MPQLIPYGRHHVDSEDIAAVIAAMQSDYLTSGPEVELFEEAIKKAVNSKHAVVVSSGTAGLHAAVHALGIGPGDEVILPALTFVATANAVLYEGGIPILADVDPETLLISPKDVESKITSRTKAIICVDYAGQPCDYQALKLIAEKNKVSLVADACHSLGATYQGKPVGSLADITVFSFHPVKHITSGEGGAIVTDNESWATNARRFRNHGISKSFRERTESSSWKYEVLDLGFNYRLPDLLCALGRNQIKHLPKWVEQRQKIAARYDQAFAGSPYFKSLRQDSDRTNSFHIYVIRMLGSSDPDSMRNDLFQYLRKLNIGTNVHYTPLHLLKEHKKLSAYVGGQNLPHAEDAYSRILTIPIFPTLKEINQEKIIQAIMEFGKNRKSQ